MGANINLSWASGVVNGAGVTATVVTGRPITIHKVGLGIYASANNSNCGYVSLREGTTEFFRGYTYGSGMAASAVSVGNDWELGVTLTPTANVNVLYTAVSNATTGMPWFTWSQ